MSKKNKRIQWWPWHFGPKRWHTNLSCNPPKVSQWQTISDSYDRWQDQDEKTSSRRRGQGRSRRERLLGLLLIGIGSVSLLFALLFSGLNFSGQGSSWASRRSGKPSRLKQWIMGGEKAAPSWDLSQLRSLRGTKEVPSARGLSALDSFYAQHPAVYGDEEYYLDSSAWAAWRESGGATGATGAAGSLAGAGSAGGMLGGASGGFGAGATTEADSMTYGGSSRRRGLWTGPADGMLSVDTSIRPLQEQLRRQQVNSVFSPAVADSDSAPSGLFAEAGLASGAGSGVGTGSGASVGAASGTSGSATSGSGSDLSALTSSLSATPEGTVPTSQRPLHVEFWESPVHYKGYQLSGNNLILYGINDADTLRFENHPDGIWMYHKAAIYRLKPSSSMQRFELISGVSSLEEPEEALEDEVETPKPKPAGAAPSSKPATSSKPASTSSPKPTSK